MSSYPRRPVGRRAPGDGLRTFWAMAAVAGVVCLLGVGRAWTRVAVMERSRDVGLAREEGLRLTRELHALDLEQARLSGAGRVTQAAEERLQMHRPGNAQVVALPLPPQTPAQTAVAGRVAASLSSAMATAGR